MKTTRVRLSVLATIIAAAFSIGACTTAPTSVATQAAAETTRLSQVRLAEGNWDAFNREQLDRMIATYGKFGPNYNPARPPYVVFDWDNTTIFLDIEEAALIYQLENLRFGATPEQLDKAIRTNIPTKDFTQNFRNAAGQPINIDRIANDITRSYTWLYQNYVGMKGDRPLQEIRQTPQYKDFIAKVRFLYEAIGDTFDLGHLSVHRHDGAAGSGAGRGNHAVAARPAGRIGEMAKPGRAAGRSGRGVDLLEERLARRA